MYVQLSNLRIMGKKVDLDIAENKRLNKSNQINVSKVSSQSVDKSNLKKKKIIKLKN